MPLDPTPASQHPSEVGILLWLGWFQDVLRATKDLAKNDSYECRQCEKSFCNRTVARAVWNLSVEIRADLRTSPETKAPSDNLRQSSSCDLFYFSKITWQCVGVAALSLSPLAERQPGRPLAFSWASARGLEWSAENRTLTHWGRLGAFSANQAPDSSQPLHEAGSIPIIRFLNGRMKQREAKLEIRFPSQTP